MAEEKQCACVYVCVCVRERERVEIQGVDTKEYTSINVYSQRKKTQHYTRWEEGALYSHPLSSLTKRHIKHEE